MFDPRSWKSNIFQSSLKLTSCCDDNKRWYPTQLRPISTSCRGPFHQSRGLNSSVIIPFFVLLSHFSFLRFCFFDSLSSMLSWARGTSRQIVSEAEKKEGTNKKNQSVSCLNSLSLPHVRNLMKYPGRWWLPCKWFSTVSMSGILFLIISTLVEWLSIISMSRDRFHNNAWWGIIFHFNSYWVILYHFKA